MLDSAPVAAVLATTAMDRSREFYERRLGLQPSDRPTPDPSVVLYDCGGGTQLLIYERATAGDSDATSANFFVDDVEGTVDRLRAGGVTFEDYDLPNMQTENGIMSQDSFKAAWFKDPDGNILCVSSAPS